jgi:hypothetical protein
MEKKWVLTRGDYPEESVVVVPDEVPVGFYWMFLYGAWETVEIGRGGWKPQLEIWTCGEGRPLSWLAVDKVSMLILYGPLDTPDVYVEKPHAS